MYIGVFILLFLFNALFIYLLIIVNKEMIETLTAYIYIRKISKVSIKKELLLLIFFAVGSTIAYDLSFVMILMSVFFSGR